MWRNLLMQQCSIQERPALEPSRSNRWSNIKELNQIVSYDLNFSLVSTILFFSLIIFYLMLASDNEDNNIISNTQMSTRPKVDEWTMVDENWSKK